MLRALLFDTGGQRFALPIDAVREVLRAVAVTPFPEAPPGWMGVIDVRGTLVPVCDLAVRLGLEQGPAHDPDDNLVLAEAGRGPAALWVERVDSVADVPDPEALPPMPGESGPQASPAAVRMPDGVVMILDLAGLLAVGEWESVAAAVRGVEGVDG